jgi:hypothetical protein
MSLSTFYIKIKNDVTGFFKSLPAEEQQLISELEPILTGACGQFFKAALPIAIPIVASLVTSGKTSNEKRNEAIAQLATAGESVGLTAATSVLGLVVEAAYQKVQASVPAAVQPIANAAITAADKAATIAISGAESAVAATSATAS